MKRFLVWLCTIAMLMSSIMLTPIAYAADTPTATATDVYISGNWVVGETLTAEYTYYDPAETTENTENTTFQWYYVSDSGDTAISGATSKTYTLQASDAGKNIYFVVTPNGSGNGRKVSSAGYGTVQAANSTATAPTALNAVLALTDGYNKVMPDSKIKVHYAAAFFNDEEEGETTFQWYTSDALNKAEPTAIEGATAQTYTITEAEYGKYLYAEVVVKDESGDAAAAISTAAVFVGNQVPIDGVNTSATTGTWYAEYAGYQQIFTGFGGKNTMKPRYGTTREGVVLDAEEPVKVDGFKFAVFNSTEIIIDYSNDNATWTVITQDKDGNALSTYTGTSYRTVHADIRLAAPITARYFRFRYTHSSAGTIHSFIPYLSAENRAWEMVDIISADNGITFDNTANTVTGILYGMPAENLKNSIHALNGSTVSIADASGADIADLSGIKITDATSADYRVKIARDSATHLFTLACAPAYKTDDFSTMTDSRQYWGATWGTRNFSGTADVQWYGYGSDAASSPYAVKDVTGGVTSAKIVKNGTSGDNTCAVWYGAGTNPTDKISFSFDVKMDDYSVVSLAGKIDNKNGSNTFGSKMSVGSSGIVAAGTDGLKKKVNIKPDEWYHVEIITDLENDTHTILVDGVVYAENVPFTYAQANPAKTSIFFNLLFYVTEGGENDINYLKNVQFRKVYSVSDYTSADGEEVGMTLYDGTDVVTALTPGKTYTAKNNGKIFTDNYYVAVYKVNYADDAAHTVSNCVLVDAKRIKGSAAATHSVVIPTDIQTTYDSGNIKTGAMVKVFYFNDMITPVKKPDVIR